jgi:nucleoside-diphosphate-sugar epimerase
MKLLITGGSGFLGINFIRYALNHGDVVVSLDKEPFDYPEKNKINAVLGDIRDRKMVDDVMTGVDMVIHAAAALPLYTEEEIMTTDVDGTKNILDSALLHGVKRVIHISTTAVYGIPDHHPLVENDKLDGVGPYGKAKILAEEACLDYRKKGLCVPIIRPKSFVGPERLGVFALFYDWAKDGKSFPMIGNGNNRYQLLDVEDLCEVIYSTLKLNKDTVNDIFNIGAKDFTTMKEDYQAVLDRAGFGRKIVGLPATPIIWILRILEALHLSPLYKWVYETASKDSFVSIEKAERLLLYKPKYSNKQALVRNYDWYLSNMDSFKERTGITHRVPWKQGILKIAKLFF